MPKVEGLEPNPPADESWVEMEHDGIEGTCLRHPRSVRHMERNGWRVIGTALPPANAEPVSAPAVEEATPPAPAAAPADQAVAVENVQVAPAGDVTNPARRR